jgi:exosortase A-associated hydrolase 1
MHSFEDAEPDIAAAIDAFNAACPLVRRVVLWGLCDAASAALIYWDATRDARIGGMILLNPWVRSEASLARTHIKHYYGKRFFERAFWAKLLQGGVDIAGTMRNLALGARASMANRGGVGATQRASFQDRMAEAVRGFAGPILVILSGRDLTAKEFQEYTLADPRWRGLLVRPNVERREVLEADHTFSSAEWRAMVATMTLDWLDKCARANR